MSTPDGLNEKLGIVFEDQSPERVSGHMPVAGNTQPRGMLHGGASISLAESLASRAASLHAAEHEAYAVGVDVNATHHRSAGSGTVHGVALPLHRGRTVACYEVVISDDQERRLCTARITCSLIQKSR